jgi:rhodanese-related sulfurtransferase
MEIWKAEDVKALVAKKVFMLDVREPQERANGRAIDPSVNIPLGELSLHINKVPKDKMVYVYCESGMRSQNACMLLEAKGYKASNLMGGYKAYHAIKNK